MLKTFKLGGIHPRENKLSVSAAIEELAPGEVAHLFLSQHLGAPAEAVVAKGDKVKVGQLVAKATGFVSANIHSSVSGTVTSLEGVLDHTGIRRPAISIKVEGDEWLEGVNVEKEFNLESLSSADIISKVNQAGIVGLGGAAFPSYVKLSVPPSKKAEIVIINGAECEPYLTSDYRLMIEQPEAVLKGVQLIMKASGAPKACIGIENNKPEAISKLRSFLSKYNGIEVVALKTKYPQGGEKQLIKACINREVPSGGLPIDVGAVVQNVGTAFAIYEAVVKNKPLVENIITITGKNAKQQKNYLVRIGTPLNVVVEAAGGLPESTAKVILGGPMMGKAISNIEAPTQKSASAILLMDEKEAKREKAGSCIRCARCVSVCPMGLEPYLLMKQSTRQMFDNLEHDRVYDCIECGSCSYTCPSNLPLLDYIRLGKVEVMKIRRNRK